MGEGTEGGTVNWIVWAMTNGAKVARWLRAERAIYTVRDLATIGILQPLHFKVIHRMRRLAVQMTDWDQHHETAAHLALEVCTQCNDTMRRLLELKSNELHCCLKLMVARPGAPDEDRVATWARSEPRDDRPVEQGDGNAHLVSRNTVWSALLGRNDGVTQWRPFPCFACNNLPKQVDRFRCDRDNWARYYRSTLVFPLRFQNDPHCSEYRNIGFLAFDSRKIGAFRNLPDIFDFRENWTGYRDRLESSTAFHMGAIFADVLSGFLRGAYDSSNRRDCHVEQREAGDDEATGNAG